VGTFTEIGQVNYDRILITGGGGLIGSHIADQLVELGIEEIVILDNFTRGAHSNLAQAISHGRVKLIEGDIRDRNLVMEVMKGIDLGVPSSSDSNHPVCRRAPIGSGSAC
jgi:nucleoside-diphosphate-sugar epimerase